MSFEMGQRPELRRVYDTVVTATSDPKASTVGTSSAESTVVLVWPLQQWVKVPAEDAFFFALQCSRPFFEFLRMTGLRLERLTGRGNVGDEDEDA